MIPGSVAKQVLLVGPDYRNHRGGIGAVIGNHKEHYEVFNFVPSFRPYNNKLLKSFYFVGQLFKIVVLLTRNRQIRIVHIHSSKNGSMYRKLCVACVSKYLFGKKVINHVHTGNFKRFYDGSNSFSQRCIVYFLKLSDATITVSDSWKLYFESRFGLQNVYKISNMVKSPPGNETPSLKNLRKVSFLFLGLIIDNKGIFDLISVLIENKSMLHHRVKLYVGGNGDTSRLKEMILKNDLGEMVEFKGWVTGTEKHELLQKTDVFILPSYYEGLPVSILEAMSYGKAVISTRVGGIPEVVEENGNGLLIKPGDRKALKDALSFYINDPDMIMIHGRRSSAIVGEYFPESVIPKLEAVYTSLLNETSVAWLP
jgi:glycosyltransferase involved in cell wall biosynthesis